MTHEEVLDEVNVIYERISQHSKDYDSAWSDGNYTEALEILIDYYEVGLIEELEKIKAEMQDYGCSFIIAKRSDLASVVSNCIRMVDKHISELKGE